MHTSVDVDPKARPTKNGLRDIITCPLKVGLRRVNAPEIISPGMPFVRLCK